MAATKIAGQKLTETTSPVRMPVHRRGITKRSTRTRARSQSWSWPYQMALRAGTESTAITGTRTTDDATSAWHRLTAATFDQAMPQITAMAAIESQTESTIPAVEPTTSKMR